MDKIGDLVVSLNAEGHPGLRDSECTWAIARGLEWVVETSLPSKNYMSFSKTFSRDNLQSIVEQLKREQFEQAIVFHAPWFMSLAIFLAGIPVRGGRLSQWHSFLLFNKGLRQKRSLSEKHESEYNFDLISRTTGVPWNQNDFSYPELSVSRETVPIELEDNYIVVHPGMMGSALNWPVENYIELVRTLAKNNQVVVTGTAADQPWTDPLKDNLSDYHNICWAMEKLNPSQLMTVLKGAETVVAPSTGIIHLAAGLGTRVVGFYSPVTAESKVRWGPLTHNAILFTPAKSEMNEITVNEVLSQAFSERASL